MSFILGVNLLRKVFLVSDTRITSKTSSGLYKVEDDFIKSVTLNERISSVAAGNAALAAFVLRKLKKDLGPDAFFSDLKIMIESHIEQIVIEYVNTTGRENESSSFIFAGFNSAKGKVVNSRLAGQAMSAPVIAKGRGAVVNQAIEPALIKAIAEGAIKFDGMKGGQDIVVEGIPDSQMISLEVNTNRGLTKRFSMSSVKCYECVFFSPSSRIGKINMPPQTIGDLEFREQKGMKVEAILYEDSEILMNYISSKARENDMFTVGGHIFPTMVTELGTIFPTGTLATNREGRVVILGKMIVSDGKLSYQLEDGREGQYRQLEKYEEPSGLETI